MTALLPRVRQAALNPPRLARHAIRNPRLLPAILAGLDADRPRIKYGCAKALRLLSEQQPKLLYRHFGSFVRLLDHENKILQWDAAFVLSHLARVDTRNQFAAIFRKYFSPIHGPVMITAANVIQGAARIAQTNPRWADRIAAEVLKVARARYQTAECRNVAIGHAIVTYGAILPLLRRPAPVVRFVRRQARSPRPATRKKALQLLQSLPSVSQSNSAR